MSNESDLGTRNITPIFRSIAGPGLLLILALGTVALTFTGRYYLALLPGILFSALLVFNRSPHWIYLLVVGLIPFWGVRQLAGINVQWPLGLLMLFIVLMHYLPQKKVPESIRSGFWPLFIILLSVFMLSAYISPFPNTAWENVRLLIAAILFVAFGFVFIDRELYLHSLPKVIIWTVTFGSFVAVWDYFFDIPFVPPGEVGFALTSHPNNLAQMAIFAIPLVVHELFYRTNFANRFVMLVVLIINGAGVMVSFSRAGFLILTAMVCILAYEYARKFHAKNTGLIIAAVSMGLAAAFLLTPAEYWERQRSLIEWQDSSLKRRTAYIDIGWEAFLESPLLGTGPGTFQDIYPLSQKAADFRTDRESQMRRHAHNGYLELLVGAGILGLSIYLLILLKSVRQFSRAKQLFLKQGNEELVSLTGCYRASLISMILYLSVGSFVYHKHLLLVIAISHAASLVSTGISKEKHNNGLSQ